MGKKAIKPKAPAAPRIENCTFNANALDPEIIKAVTAIAQAVTENALALQRAAGMLTLPSLIRVSDSTGLTISNCALHGK